MNRDLETFKGAEQCVKINHFTQKGYDIKGVMHVGTHNGYEIEHYLNMGIDNVLGFEPFYEAFSQCMQKYKQAVLEGKLKLFNIGLGSKINNMVKLNITEGDGQGSTFLTLKPEIPQSKPYFQRVVNEQMASITTFAFFLEHRKNVDISKYDCLVIDAQGMELEVLIGMGKYLDGFKYLNIECSKEPIYEGEAPALQISSWLFDQGFIRDSEIEEHNDIFFIKGGD